MSGYVCQWLGNLECSDQFELQCLGSGSIDCTQDCPGGKYLSRPVYMGNYYVYVHLGLDYVFYPR